MTAAFDIRRARPSDLQAMAALHAASFISPWDEDTFSSLMAQAGVTALVAMMNEHCHGFVVARRAADEAEILSIAVTLDQRRLGIGRQLLESAIDACRDAGASAMFIEVAAADMGTIDFYDRAGFIACGRRLAYYPDRPAGANDALIMRRTHDLDPQGAGSYKSSVSNGK